MAKELTPDEVLAIQKENDSLKADLEKYGKDLADERLKSEVLQKELQETKAQNEDLGAELEKLLKDSEKKESAVNSIVVNPEPAPVVLPEVKVGKTKYKFLKGIFILAGVQYKAEEAAADKDLLEALLKIDGQQIIKEVH